MLLAGNPRQSLARETRFPCGGSANPHNFLAVNPAWLKRALCS